MEAIVHQEPFRLGISSVIGKPVFEDELSNVLQERSNTVLIPAGASEQPVVLLVEDNTVSIRFARAILAYMLPGAVTVATEQHIDVLLMDLHIPGVDGFEAARRILRYQTDTGARRNAIIALSADVRSEERERCLATGMNTALGKPIDETELRSSLKEFLESGGFAVSEDQGVSEFPAGAEEDDVESAPNFNRELFLRSIRHDHALCAELIEFVRADI